MSGLASAEFSGAAFAVVAGFAALIAGMAASGAAPRARMSLRFAAALGGALALVDLLAAVQDDAAGIAAAVTVLVAALVPAVLALAAYAQMDTPPRTGLTALLLALGCLSGLVAAATGAVLFAFTPLVLAAAVLLALAGRLWTRARMTAALFALAGGGFIAAAAAWMGGHGAGRTGFVLFFAASVLAVTLALARRSDLALESATRRTARGAVFIGGED